MGPRGTEHALSAPARRGRLAENGIVGMAIAVFVEVMLFAGFISAFVIVRNSTPAGLWPPPGQLRLPVASTAFNTALLLASGVLLFLAHRAFPRRGARATAPLMGAAIVLGALFVLLQGPAVLFNCSISLRRTTAWSQ